MDYGVGYIVPHASVDRAFLDTIGEFDIYEKMAYVLLSRFLNADAGFIAFPSIEKMSELMGVTKPTTIKALKGLEEKGLVTIEKVKASGINKRNVYHLKPYTKTGKMPAEKVEAEVIPYKEIIEYLNAKADKKFKYAAKATQTKIRARWNEGFNIDDFKKVIDNMTAKWKNNPEMNEYLRPETLFGTKFESYLNAKVKQQTSGPTFKQPQQQPQGRIMSEEERMAMLRDAGLA